MKCVLVTGGAGYIGSHACKALALAGYIPITFDNLIHGHRWAVRWGPLVEGDLNNPNDIAAVFEHYHPFAVMHFASYINVGESVQQPAKYYRNNLVGTLNLLEAMLHHDINNIVFSSTCATYGTPIKTPIDETHPRAPINPYGVAKLTVEYMLQDFAYAHGLRAVTLRYFNAAGADSKGEIGEAHEPETHLIPLALQVAFGQRPYLQVFGDDYSTPDGSCIRDYIHVSDLAQAHILALRYLEHGGENQVFNLGNGQGYSVFEVIEYARRITGHPIPINIAARRAGDPPILTACADRAHQVLNWQPRYSDLLEIMTHAWTWHRQSPSLHDNHHLR